jgi:hypothetical protein
MAAQDVENPGSAADGIAGNPTDVKAAAGKRRHPAMTFISCLGLAIAFIVYVASVILVGFIYDSPSNFTRTLGIVVGAIGMASGWCLTILFMAVFHLSYV